jgi:phage gpG-like protein
MAALGFSVTRNDVSPALAKMARTARHPQAVFRAMGTTFMSITMGNFKIDPSYRPKPWPAKRDGSPSHLMLHNVLSRSFHLEATDSYAKVGTPVIYARIHQFGGVIHGKPWLRFMYGANQWATVASVKMPARPYFPVDDSGRLTPKAAEKIRAAGERALAREAQS